MSMITNRRSFLYGASVAGFGIFAEGRRGWARGVGPNETLNIACIGVGGKGESDTRQAARHGRILGLCDIDQIRLDAMAGNGSRMQRNTLIIASCCTELDSKIDAVVVSTPDHTHAPAAVAAMRLGKHVYCQKPLAHSVWECRLMRETARQKGVCTQMGNQGTADPGFRRGAELVRSGAIGEVREVHIWTNRPFKYWKQAPDIVARPSEEPVPKHVHWDLFLGTAPERPYNSVYHPHNWRGWWDFGTGSLGDMACHTANLTFMALQLGLPVKVSAKSGEINSETYPAWATITYEFPARGNLPPVKLTWYEGAKNGKRNLPPNKLFPDSGVEPSSSGSLLIGSKWRMYSPNDYGAVQMLWPVGEYHDIKVPEPTLPRIEGAHGELTTARSWNGSRPSAPASRRWRCRISTTPRPSPSRCFWAMWPSGRDRPSNTAPKPARSPAARRPRSISSPISARAGRSE